MTVAINQPNRKPSMLEEIAAAVDIAQGIYGIKFKMDEVSALKDKAKAEAEQNKIDRENQAKDRADTADYRQKMLGQADRKLGLQEKEIDVKTKQLGSAKSQSQKLPPGALDKFGDARDAISQLSDMNRALNEKQDLFGPISGRVRSANPYDTQGQSMQAVIKTAKQTIGKYLEGGVLRKEDEAKYDQIMPKLSDTWEVAQFKMKNLEQRLSKKMAGDVAALEAQGYKIEGLNIPTINIAQEPAKKSASGSVLMPAAQADSRFDIDAFIRGK